VTDPLQERLLHTQNPIDDSDWLDVRRRARRARPSRVALIAVAALLAAVATLLATPAFGLRGRLLDAIHGSPAPINVQTVFSRQNEVTRHFRQDAREAGIKLKENVPPEADPAQARGVAGVQTPDGPVYLWAAPTADGGQCWFIEVGRNPETGELGGHGTCDDDRRTGIVSGGLYWDIQRPSVQIAHARVFDGSITRVEVRLEGGDTVSLPVYSGHAIGIVPRDASLETYVGLNANGDEVTRDP
jgi:hypothetical protein